MLVRANGLVTPLFWRIWVQDKEKSANAKLTKIELTKDMLLSLREVTSVRLWVARDRWFLCKELFNGSTLKILIGLQNVTETHLFIS